MRPVPLAPRVRGPSAATCAGIVLRLIASLRPAAGQGFFQQGSTNYGNAVALNSYYNQYMAV